MKTMSNPSRWAPGAEPLPLKAALLHLLAMLLRAGSEALTRLAARAAEADAARTLPAGTVEFHALHREAGAPEGALYVDGKLVAVLPGVRRL
jgi:hypothetical protein